MIFLAAAKSVVIPGSCFASGVIISTNICATLPLNLRASVNNVWYEYVEVMGLVIRQRQAKTVI